MYTVELYTFGEQFRCAPNVAYIMPGYEVTYIYIIDYSYLLCICTCTCTVLIAARDPWLVIQLFFQEHKSNFSCRSTKNRLAQTHCSITGNLQLPLPPLNKPTKLYLFLPGSHFEQPNLVLKIRWQNFSLFFGFCFCHFAFIMSII